jgi:hypothetical protein
MHGFFMHGFLLAGTVWYTPLTPFILRPNVRDMLRTKLSADKLGSVGRIAIRNETERLRDHAVSLESRIYSHLEKATVLKHISSFTTPSHRYIWTEGTALYQLRLQHIYCALCLCVRLRKLNKGYGKLYHTLCRVYKLRPPPFPTHGIKPPFNVRTCIYIMRTCVHTPCMHMHTRRLAHIHTHTHTARWCMHAHAMHAHKRVRMCVRVCVCVCVHIGVVNLLAQH